METLRKFIIAWLSIRKLGSSSVLILIKLVPKINIKINITKLVSLFRCINDTNAKPGQVIQHCVVIKHYH